MRAILPVLVCLLVAACGLKDDLYLPEDPETTTPTSQEDDRAEDA